MANITSTPMCQAKISMEDIRHGIRDLGDSIDDMFNLDPAYQRRFNLRVNIIVERVRASLCELNQNVTLHEIVKQAGPDIAKLRVEFKSVMPDKPKQIPNMNKAASKPAFDLQFPPYEPLKDCLKYHPLTSEKMNPYLVEKGVIAKVAETFASSTKAPSGVDMGSMLDLYDIQIEPRSIPAIHMNVSEALKECAMPVKPKD